MQQRHQQQLQQQHQQYQQQQQQQQRQQHQLQQQQIEKLKGDVIAAESASSAQIAAWKNAPDEISNMRAEFAAREQVSQDALVNSMQKFETQYMELVQTRDEQYIELV